ncbi:MAG: protein phosphatase 2C domain-containing protein [Candidatus Margulisiibacteriota bacterium]
MTPVGPVVNRSYDAVRAQRRITSMQQAFSRGNVGDMRTHLNILLKQLQGGQSPLQGAELVSARNLLIANRSHAELGTIIESILSHLPAEQAARPAVPPPLPQQPVTPPPPPAAKAPAQTTVEMFPVSEGREADLDGQAVFSTSNLGGVSNIGHGRKVQEDGMFLAVQRDTEGNIISILAVVADGMGGHAYGGEARDQAINAFFVNYTSLAQGTSVDVAPLIRSAHKNIVALNSGRSGQDAGGTTVATLLIEGNQAFVRHVGDSRVYRLRDNNLRLLTIDDTVAMDTPLGSEKVAYGPTRHGELVTLKQQGKIMDEALSEFFHETANNMEGGDILVRLSQALGIEGIDALNKKLAQPLIETDALSGDVFLVVSDGAYGSIPFARLREMLIANQHRTGLEIAQVVKDDALGEMQATGHGKDNITALVVKVGPEQAEENIPEISAELDLDPSTSQAPAPMAPPSMSGPTTVMRIDDLADRVVSALQPNLDPTRETEIRNALADLSNPVVLTLAGAMNNVLELVPEVGAELRRHGFAADVSRLEAQISDLTTQFDATINELHNHEAAINELTANIGQQRKLLNKAQQSATQAAYHTAIVGFDAELDRVSKDREQASIRKDNLTRNLRTAIGSLEQVGEQIISYEQGNADHRAKIEARQVEQQQLRDAWLAEQQQRIQVLQGEVNQRIPAESKAAPEAPAPEPIAPAPEEATVPRASVRAKAAAAAPEATIVVDPEVNRILASDMVTAEKAAELASLAQEGKPGAREALDSLRRTKS